MPPSQHDLLVFGDHHYNLIKMQEYSWLMTPAGRRWGQAATRLQNVQRRSHVHTFLFSRAFKYERAWNYPPVEWNHLFLFPSWRLYSQPCLRKKKKLLDGFQGHLVWGFGSGPGKNPSDDGAEPDNGRNFQGFLGIFAIVNVEESSGIRGGGGPLRGCSICGECDKHLVLLNLLGRSLKVLFSLGVIPKWREWSCRYLLHIALFFRLDLFWYFHVSKGPFTSLGTSCNLIKASQINTGRK